MVKNYNENSFLEFFRNHLDFAKTYFSLYYPFTEEEVIKYWDYLEPGDAHYSVYIQDNETVYDPKIGLCFNENIEWTPTLKKKWDVGFRNPFAGYIDGLIFPVEHNDVENGLDLNSVLPLSLVQLHHEQDSAAQNFMVSNYGVDEWLDNMGENVDDFNENIKKEFNEITFSNFIQIFEKYETVLFYNNSIWKNTLKKIIGNEFMLKIVNSIIKENSDI